eukprot:682771-Pleurochrysis_carterae.AAC.2
MRALRGQRLRGARDLFERGVVAPLRHDKGNAGAVGCARLRLRLHQVEHALAHALGARLDRLRRRRGDGVGQRLARLPQREARPPTLPVEHIALRLEADELREERAEAAERLVAVKTRLMTAREGVEAVEHQLPRERAVGPDRRDNQP